MFEGRARWRLPLGASSLFPVHPIASFKLQKPCLQRMEGSATKSDIEVHDADNRSEVAKELYRPKQAMHVKAVTNLRTPTRKTRVPKAQKALPKQGPRQQHAHGP